MECCSCSCSIFPCFTDSAQPASSEIGISSLNVNSRDSVKATHAVDSSLVTSHSATPLPPPSSPLAASSSQSIVAPEIRGFQVDSSSKTSSFCVPNKSDGDHAENKRESAGARDIGNASPLALQSSHATSISGTAVSTRNASDNIVSQDSQAICSSGASSSQPYVPSSSTPSSHDSQAICSSGASSSQPYVPSSSTPSPSVPKKLDYIRKIKDSARSVDTGNINADLNELSNYISQYLAFIKGEREKPSQPTAAKRDWPGSKCVFKLKELVGQGGEAVKDFCGEDAKTIAQKSLQGLGSTHILLTGFLVVGNIMERYEKISKNKEVCLSLLDGMNTLVQYVKMLQERLRLKEGMKTQIEKAIKLIIKVSLAYCTQIDKPKYILFFSTTAIEEKLVDFQKKLSALHNEIQMQMGVHLSDGIEKIDNRLRKEPSYPQYPDAYGIKRQVEKVIELLEWESHERAIAVILHGLGGMGKTTLADAVFATLRNKKMEGCKYSFVRLFDDITPVPNIPKLKRCILRDLKMGEETAKSDIRRAEDGQNEIAVMLGREEAFIYIDNVLFPDTVQQGRDAIEQLLPINITGNAKKLRLLITARDKGAAGRVCKKRRLKTNFYSIETLPNSEATELVKKTLDGGEGIIDCSQIKKIVDICGGIPRLLKQVAEFIWSSEDQREAQSRYRMVISEAEDKWNRQIGKEIACYVFDYENCDENLRDPFLDICSYFQGWQWEELSNIVGDFELKSLENKALVTKDVKSMTATARVNDVILAIGLHRKGERFKFSGPSELKEFLDGRGNEGLRCIKGIWLHYSSCPLTPFSIPASKLDLMCTSLRVLALGNSTEVEGQCDEIYEELFFFSAGISHLPFVLSKLKKLRHLCYSPEDLQNLCQVPSNLSNLLVLRLRKAQLRRLPPELGDLVVLRGVALSNCEHLEELEESISKLGSLRTFIMDSCPAVKQLPENFGLWNSLQELHLRQCGSLESLPESIGKLKFLDSIDLSLTDIKELPVGFCSLSSLTKLAMDNCRRLEKLPQRFGDVARLRKLSLVGCNSLKKLPESFSQLKHLEDLNLSRCVTLEELCGDFKSLSSLRVLLLGTCKMLKNLPEDFHCLPLLEHLCLSDCDKLEGQPMENIVKMEKLEIVEIHRSPLLHEEWQKIEVGCIQWSQKVRSGQGSSN